MGRNDPCPCGSGKKFKKCCESSGGAGAGYTRSDREVALAALDDLLSGPGWTSLVTEAEAEFWGELDREQTALADNEMIASGAPFPGACARDDAIFTAETVFYLPGTIDIKLLGQVKQARRGGCEHELTRRCMVRGHWRRAHQGWEGQRPRWVRPHWRGPSAAASIGWRSEGGILHRATSIARETRATRHPPARRW